MQLLATQQLAVEREDSKGHPYHLQQQFILLSLRMLSNTPPPLQETINAWASIYKIEKNDQETSNRIRTELERLARHESDMTTLRAALSKAQSGLEAHTTYINRLNSSAAEVRVIAEIRLPARQTADDRVGKICHTFTACWQIQTIRRLSAIHKEEETVQREKEEITRLITGLTQEIEREETFCERLKRNIGSLEHSRAFSTTRITGLKKDLRSFRRIPQDIWIPIFQLCIHAEFTDYITKNNNRPMESTPFVLSQVCSFWRKIIVHAPTLWSVIAVHPSEYWSRGKASHFHDCLLWARLPVTFIANVSQPLSWKPPSSWNPTVKPMNIVAGSYNLHLEMESLSQTVADSVQAIPYRQPKALILSSRAPPPSLLPISMLHRFNTVESLSFTNEYSLFMPPNSLSSTLPKLTTLKFYVKRFPDGFSLLPFLTPTLRELHIRHSGEGDPPSLPVDVDLPRLRTIGITHPASGLLDKIRAPLVETMVIYGPADSPHTEFIGNMQYMQNLHTLEFVDWDDQHIDDQMINIRIGAVAVCREIASRTPQLRCLRFFGSTVDGISLIGVARERTEIVGKESPGKLDEITLSHARGITRLECERLKLFVYKLVVRV